MRTDDKTRAHLACCKTDRSERGERRRWPLRVQIGCFLSRPQLARPLLSTYLVMAPTPDLSSERWLEQILSNSHHSSPSPSPLLIVSSDSHSLSPLPLLRNFINHASPAHPVLLVSALIPPKKLGVDKGRSVDVIDLTRHVPGYDDDGVDDETGGLDDVEKRVRQATKKSECFESSSCALLRVVGWLKRLNRGEGGRGGMLSSQLLVRARLHSPAHPLALMCSQGRRHM